MQFLSKFALAALQEITDEEKICLAGLDYKGGHPGLQGWASGGPTIVAKVKLGCQEQQLALGVDTPHYLVITLSYKFSEIVLLNLYLSPHTSYQFSPYTWVTLERQF